jgi:hypothetical protein
MIRIFDWSIIEKEVMKDIETARNMEKKLSDYRL